MKKNSSIDPRVDAYIAKSKPFAQEILEHLREVMHEGAPELKETIKWSMPFFVYGGIILGNMAAFKEHCSFGLWGAATMKTLRESDVVADGAMGSFGRLTSVKDLPPRKKLVGYVKIAAKLIDDGVRTKSLDRDVPKNRVAKPEAKVPEELAAALKQNRAAQKTFDNFAPSCKREYCEWVAGAKRDETKTQRVAQAVAWMAEGKRRNWKYESC